MKFLFINIFALTLCLGLPFTASAKNVAIVTADVTNYAAFDQAAKTLKDCEP